MNAFLGSPALRLLLRLKLRGIVRRQWRRVRTPKGFLLTLLGTLAFGLWIFSLTMSYVRQSETLTGAAAEMRVRVFGLLLLMLSLSTALTNRGLYVHRNEIERLFSAPLSRSDLIRYRLLAGGLRSLLGGLVLGLFGARRMPEPWLAFAGIVLAMQTLPVVNQLVAIALGGLEERASRLLKRLGQVLLVVGLIAGFQVVFAFQATRRTGVGSLIDDGSLFDGRLLEHPVVRSLTLPFVPWAHAIAASSLAAWWPWILVCLGVHGLLFELCAALPIDFRELSLSTSARAAARVARFRRGGGIAATRASAEAARWRIPWFFGRGPSGAIAWRKCAGMARKAKGAFWMALVALLFITFFSGLLVQGTPEQEGFVAPILIAFLGTVYLCSGLRFDFREELERMDAIRAWPIAPSRVFLATLLPETVLVSILVGATVLVRSAFGHWLDLHVAGIVACVPFLVFAWVALDNVVFLFAPVRFVPGQDGFVQNAGRRMIQMALLGILASALGGLGALAYWGAVIVAVNLAPMSEAAPTVAGYTALMGVLALGNMGLTLLGGVVLRRFDVARDRG